MTHALFLRQKQGMWSNFLTPWLMELYENYLVNRSDKRYGEGIVDVITFSIFLSNFVKGTIEDRLNMYTDFIPVVGESIMIDDITEVSSRVGENEPTFLMIRCHQ